MQIFFKRQGQPRWKLKGISFAVKDMSTYSLCMCVCVCVYERQREERWALYVKKGAPLHGDDRRSDGMRGAHSHGSAWFQGGEAHSEGSLDRGGAQHKPNCLGRKSFCQQTRSRRGHCKSWRWPQTKPLFFSVAGFRIQNDLFDHCTNLGH